MDNPIIFTIKQNADLISYSITSTDSRAKHTNGTPINFSQLKPDAVIRDMEFLTSELKCEGYEVLFNVEL